MSTSTSNYKKMPRLLLLITQHIRALKNGLQQITAAPFASIITFIVIGIALALPLGLMILVQNTQLLTTGLKNTTQISIYLQNGIAKTQVDSLETLLNNDHAITNVHYISPDVGLNEFKKTMGFKNIFNALKKNPIPGVFILQPANFIKTPLQFQQLMARLQRLPQIDNVQLDTTWLQRLNAITHLLHNIAFSLLILFSFAVLMIIGNTIRLTTQKHQDEIVVIKLIGGTNRFIQRPFLYSGIIYGLAGGLIAWLLIEILMLWLQPSVSHLANLYGIQFVLKGLSTKTTIHLVILSIILGFLGSLFTVKQYLHAIEPR